MFCIGNRWDVHPLFLWSDAQVSFQIHDQAVEELWSTLRTGPQGKDYSTTPTRVTTFEAWALGSSDIHDLIVRS